MLWLRWHLTCLCWALWLLRGCFCRQGRIFLGGTVGRMSVCARKGLDGVWRRKRKLDVEKLHGGGVLDLPLLIESVFDCSYSNGQLCQLVWPLNLVPLGFDFHHPHQRGTQWTGPKEITRNYTTYCIKPLPCFECWQSVPIWLGIGLGFQGWLVFVGVFMSICMLKNLVPRLFLFSGAVVWWV